MSSKLSSDNPLLETLLFWAISKLDLGICTKLLVQKQFNKDLQWNQRKKELSFKLGLYANIQVGDTLYHILFRRNCLDKQ